MLAKAKIVNTTENRKTTLSYHTGRVLHSQECRHQGKRLELLELKILENILCRAETQMSVKVVLPGWCCYLLSLEKGLLLGQSPDL